MWSQTKTSSAVASLSKFLVEVALLVIGYPLTLETSEQPRLVQCRLLSRSGLFPGLGNAWAMKQQ